MSHFVIVVVGEDVDGQLEPYSEQDYDDKYATFEDCTSEVEADWKQYPLDLLAEGGSDVEYKTIEEYAEGYHGYKKNEEGSFGYLHNPNAQWDWYEVGGRWDGFFTDTDDNKVNQIAVKDLDIEGARDTAEAKARKDFAVWEAIFTRLGQPKSWDELRDSEPNIDKARAKYHAQPSIKAFKEVDTWNDPVTEYGFDEEAYVADRRDSVFVPFAVVKDGKWVGKGQMGWFGTSRDDKTDEEWSKSFQDLLTDLPPDTLLTAVDCHI